LTKSAHNERGDRVFQIGASDDHVTAEHKCRLIAAFTVVTKGVLEAVEQWTTVRVRLGSPEELRARFPKAM
jgi:hypothetical protein